MERLIRLLNSLIRERRRLILIIEELEQTARTRETVDKIFDLEFQLRQVNREIYDTELALGI